MGWLSEEDGGNPNQQQRKLKLGASVRHVRGSLTHKHGRTWARAALLRRLKRHKADPELMARISGHSHPPLPFDEMIELFSRSKLSLGFNEIARTYLFKHPLLLIRTRDFEAIASGACHFIRRMPDWEPYFEEDRDVLCYGSEDELADKIRYYLDPMRDAERKRIRRNARDRAVQDHTWTKRFGDIFDALGIRS